MNNADREYLEKKFWEVHEKLNTNIDRLARIETKYSMVCKFAGIIGGTIALITSIVIKILWR